MPSMETLLPQESPIAICFFGNDQDTNNQCLLTENHLSLIRKGKIATFPLDDIHHISFTKRKLMLPLLTGGFFAPLSFIAISEKIFNPWGILIWLLLNLLLIYYGWTGYNAFTVNFNGFHRDFPIKTKTANLKAFAVFVNNYLAKKKVKTDEVINPVFHIIEKEKWEVVKDDLEYSPPSIQKEGFIHLCDKNQIQTVLNRYYQNQQNLLLLHINPLKLKYELKYDQVYERQPLYPHLYGPLNLSAVIKAEAVSFQPPLS